MPYSRSKPIPKNSKQALTFAISIVCATTSSLANTHNTVNTGTSIQNTQQHSLLTLKANPHLFKKHLQSLIIAEDNTRLKTILPHYKELNNTDLFVINNADALLAKMDGTEYDVGIDNINTEHGNTEHSAHSDNQLNTDIIPDKPVLTTDNIENTGSSQVDTNNNENNTDSEINTILADPQLFTIYINKLVAIKHIDELKARLPAYRVMEGRDEFLIQYADALVYRADGKNNEAIQIYKEMLASDPSLHPVRINLAMTLLENKEYNAAKSQLIKLKGEELPAPVLVQVERSLLTINNSEEWKNSVSMRPIYNNNANGVPTTKITTDIGSTVDPIKAYGLQATANSSKRINLANNFYTNIGAGVSASAYLDHSEYNDYQLTVSNTFGYDDAKNGALIKPFVTKRWYAEKDYNTNYGINIGASRWITPKFKLSANTQYSENKHTNQQDVARNNQGYFAGLSSVYIQNPSQYFFGGMSYYKNDVEKSEILNYDRNSAYVGWGKEWTKGVSTSISASYAKNMYHKPESNGYYGLYGGELGSAREDSSISFSTQLWQRDYTIIGLTPKLSLNYSNTSSNFAYYDKRKTLNGTVILNKTF